MYKKLTEEEIALLTAAGCKAEDWARVKTSSPETLKYIDCCALFPFPTVVKIGCIGKQYSEKSNWIIVDKCLTLSFDVFCVPNLNLPNDLS